VIEAELKEQIKERLEDGELVSDGHRYATYAESNRVTFDWKRAAMNGLFTEEQAKPFLKTTAVKSVTIKTKEAQ
jgi:hypothetical protein